MNVQDYLRRIRLMEEIRPDLDGLRALHRAHLLTIPYENLDVQLGRPLTIEIAPICEKIVNRRRGGWCYEMNGLFGWALGELGFRVTRMASGVMREVSGDAAVGNHLILQVELPEGLYLADVGFGDGSLVPMTLAPGKFGDGRFEFALSHPEPGWWRFHNHPKGGAKSFDFRLAPADESLLAKKCAYLQRWEESMFVQNLICQRHTAGGVTVLRGRMLRKITPAGAEDRLLDSAEELVSALQTEFDLNVPEAASLWPKVVARHAALFGTG
jgi:N-hydroxyarylamine O-acetyltransferase